MKKTNKFWIPLFLAPTCILFLLVFAIPLVMVFGTSLFEYRLMPKTFQFIASATSSNYSPRTRVFCSSFGTRSCGS